MKKLAALFALLALFAASRGADAWPFRGFGGAPIAPVNTAAPVASGLLTVGNVLSVTNGFWVGTLPITYTYQWYQDTTGSPIGGATANTYTTVSGDIGHNLFAVVTASNGHLPNGTAASNTLSIQGVAPSNSGGANAPVVSGTPIVGATLASTTGTWSGTPTITYTYQWYQDTTGSPIGGATSASYVVQSGDVGHALFAVVTGTNTYGNSTAQSNSVTISGGNVLAANFYIDPDNATGVASDSNAGTSIAHPWLHVPGQYGCTGTCNATASTNPTPVAGQITFCVKTGGHIRSEIITNAKLGTVSAPVWFDGNCWPYDPNPILDYSTWTPLRQSAIFTGLAAPISLTFTAWAGGGACPGANCVSVANIASPVSTLHPLFNFVEIDTGSGYQVYNPAQYPNPSSLHYYLNNPCSNSSIVVSHASNPPSWTDSICGGPFLAGLYDSTVVPSVWGYQMQGNQIYPVLLTSFTGGTGGTISGVSYSGGTNWGKNGAHNGNYTYTLNNTPDGCVGASYPCYALVNRGGGTPTVVTPSTISGGSWTLYANISPGTYNVQMSSPTVHDQTGEWGIEIGNNVNNVKVNGFDFREFNQGYAYTVYLTANGLTTTNNYFHDSVGGPTSMAHGGSGCVFTGNVAQYGRNASPGFYFGTTNSSYPPTYPTVDSCDIEHNVTDTIGYSSIRLYGVTNSTVKYNFVRHVAHNTTTEHGSGFTNYGLYGSPDLNNDIEFNTWYNTDDTLTLHGSGSVYSHNVNYQGTEYLLQQGQGGQIDAVSNIFFGYDTQPPGMSWPTVQCCMFDIQNIGSTDTNQPNYGVINMTNNVGDRPTFPTATPVTVGLWGVNPKAGSLATCPPPNAAHQCETLTWVYPTNAVWPTSGPGAKIDAKTITPASWNITGATVVASDSTSATFINDAATGSFVSATGSSDNSNYAQLQWGTNWTGTNNISFNSLVAIPPFGGWTVNGANRSTLATIIQTGLAAGPSSRTMLDATTCLQLGGGVTPYSGDEGENFYCP